MLIKVRRIKRLRYGDGHTTYVFFLETAMPLVTSKSAGGNQPAIWPDFDDEDGNPEYVCNDTYASIDEGGREIALIFANTEDCKQFFGK